MASTYLTRTNGSAVTAERRTFTISFWLKISAVGVEHALCSAGNGGGSEEFCMRIRNDNTLEVWHYDGSTFVGRKRTNRLFRDTNAWYHIFCQYDTTESTADDRIKLYINGIRETSFADSVNPTLNDNTTWNVDERHQIGSNSWNNSGNGADHLNGCMSHFYNVAGSIIDVSQFGSQDATTGEWKINTNPTIASYGTAGFLVLKDGNTVTDQSPNSNNFTVGGGTLTKTEDCPSNVFCTMNPLDNHFASSTFSNGNNTIVTNNSNYTWNTGTLGMTSGKFYWEVKYSANSTGSYYNLIGIADRPTDNSQDPLGRQTDCSNYGYYAENGEVYAKSTSGTTFGNTYAVGDIVGVAVDLDNSKLYFSKNGTWQNSGVPTSGSTGTGAISIDAISSTTTGVYFPASGDWGSSQYATNQHNFGNGYFGTTAVSSAGTNASGIGIFEYDVPTGYTALSTKGLNT